MVCAIFTLNQTNLHISDRRDNASLGPCVLVVQIIIGILKLLIVLFTYKIDKCIILYEVVGHTVHL